MYKLTGKWEKFLRRFVNYNLHTIRISFSHEIEKKKKEEKTEYDLSDLSECNETNG